MLSDDDDDDYADTSDDVGDDDDDDNVGDDDYPDNFGSTQAQKLWRARLLSAATNFDRFLSKVQCRLVKMMTIN